ncbi:MAG: Hydrogen cyanide synthase subunit HcnC [Alphaproteobacteria bacterium MarineAlpha6_Bin4]|nr:MAG: Hydrogen cyanide synthase subunit HcnC [Alphaproteobacteria bacterium MarineAlpha6_Bin3]PPR37898.1 MAG: Hydrogen cyanide synthase subunit HcnC [Alphaproteobacteria bacterium MarineAlpha6_Bin4]|tara:strand:- start:5099 stop:6214 length:1116 start_codon:yes stop_codon:yes gene_type:complete
MVLIIGGGIIGLSIAWRLTGIGKKVLIIDKSNFGKEASWAAAGMLSGRLDLKPSEKSLLPIFEKSHYAWPKFAKELENKSGKSIGYRKEGTLMVACDINEENKLKKNYNFLKKNGINVFWLSGNKIRQKEPYVSSNVLSGIFSPGDHHVNNRYTIDALITILKKNKNNCIFKENTEVTKIITEKNKVVGVKTKNEIIKTKEIIVCSGAWTNKIKNIQIKEVPIRPVKGQMICLKIPKGNTVLKHILWRENVYLVPRDNYDLIIGATEEEMGFDKSLTAGGIYNLLKIGREILPVIEDLSIIESWSGLRPTTRDEAPIIGPSKKIKGLIYATGHHRNGILLAPFTSSVIKNYYLNGKIENDCDKLKPGRFVV